MKRMLMGLFSGFLILAACRPVSATEASFTPPPPSQTATIIPSTSTPSPTQIPPTETITPLPTIPTFTPTFDAQTIVTVTPAPTWQPRFGIHTSPHTKYTMAAPRRSNMQ